MFRSVSSRLNGFIRFSNITQTRKYSAHLTDSGSYEGPGKTTFTTVNEATKNMVIEAYATDGFRLGRSFKAKGPIIILPKGVYAWKVEDYNDITEDSLSLFNLLNPKPEIIIVGYGATNPRIDMKSLHHISTKTGLNIEWVPTNIAISMFNYLSHDKRSVAAALIPPRLISDITENDRTASERIVNRNNLRQSLKNTEKETYKVTTPKNKLLE